MTSKEWIKKDDVMDIIKGLPKDLWEEYIYMLKGVWCDEDMQIEALQAEPKHGEWIEEKDGWYGGQGCRCSSCGYGYSYKAYHDPYEFGFCPNCGCAMTKEKEK